MEFLKEYWWIIVVALVVIVAISIMIAVVIKKKQVGKEEKTKKEEPKKEEVIEEQTPSIKSSSSSKNAIKSSNNQGLKKNQVKTSTSGKKAQTESLKKKSIKKENVRKEPAKKEESSAQVANTQEKPEGSEKSKSRPAKYIISYDKNARLWVVKKTGSSRASKRFVTKAEALEYAEALSQKQNLNLTVKKKDGKFQKQN